MLNLDLDEARAGMVLGQDVLGSQGQLLLRAGATLNDKHLQVLRANRIQYVSIGPDSDSAPTANLDGAAVETHLEERFRISDATHPLIQELRRLCHKRLVGQQGESDGD
jgi:hypothetical protein